MYDGLRVHHYVDLVRVQVKQPFGFYYLESLVHHGCGVNGHLCTHVPVRVLEGLLCRSCRNSGSFPGTERSSGGCQVNFFHTVAFGCEQTLKNGGVLGIHRQYDGIVFEHGAYDDRACRNQGLLVGQGNCLSCFKSRKGRTQPAESNHRSYHDIYRGHLDQFAQTVHSGPHLYSFVLQCIGGFLIF